MKQLFTLIATISIIAYSSLQAQIVRDFQLPPGMGYTYTVHGTGAPGYTFLGSYRFSAAANYPSTLLLIDQDGAPVYYNDYPIPDGTMADLRLHDNGLMSYFRFDEATESGQYFIMDSTFTVIDSVRCGNGAITDGHEFLMLPNGHYLLLCLEFRIADLSALHTDDGIQGDTDGVVKAPIIQELDQNKNVIFGWHGVEHYDVTDMEEYFFLEPHYLDFGHANSLEVDPDGNILLSLRFFNEITKINREDSSIIWRWGGLKNQFTFVNDPVPFSTQHHCRRLPNGHITMFDNGEVANPPLARGVEYELDEVNFTATKVWERANVPGILSFAMGSMQRLPNGNNLIDWGAVFMPGFSNDIEESTPSGQLIWEFDWPVDYFGYRAYKDTPSWDMEAVRPVVSCDTAGGQTVLSTLGTYASYLWSTGDTTPSITVTAPGEYHVLVNHNDGRGYFGSRLKVLDNIGNPCDPTDTLVSAIESVSAAQFSVYPNPATTMLNVQTGYTNTEVVLYNSLGMEVLQQPLGSHSERISLLQVANGSYTGVIMGENGKPLHRFKLMIAR